MEKLYTKSHSFLHCKGTRCRRSQRPNSHLGEPEPRSGEITARVGSTVAPRDGRPTLKYTPLTVECTYNASHNIYKYGHTTTLDQCHTYMYTIARLKKQVILWHANGY